MKHIKPINKKAVRISRREPDVFAYSPLPIDCSSGFWPGIEVHAFDEDDPQTTSSTDMNVSTQGLCSPFVKDTNICICYWPAHDPDVIIEETPGYNWNPGDPQNPSADCSNIYQDWQKLRFVYPKSGQGADAWDKSDLNDLNEIYIRDNWADNGTEPSTGDPWESPDIFIRYKDEPPSDFPDPDVDYHQGNPKAGEKNFLYARIQNNYTRPDKVTVIQNIQQQIQQGKYVTSPAIDHVFVKFYVHGLTTNPTGWELVGHAMARDIIPGEVRVVKSVKPWIPKDVGPACMMVIADSTQDPVKIMGNPPDFAGYDDKIGPQPFNVSVPEDNNVAQRNMVAVVAVPGWDPEIPFNINPVLSPGLKPDWYRIEVERPTLPKEAGISLKLPPDLIEKIHYPLGFRFLELSEKIFQFFIPILKVYASGMARLQNRIINRISLNQEQGIEASIVITLPPSIRIGQEHRIVIRQYLGKKVLGGITVSVRVVGPQNVRFIGNVETKEVHLSFCSKVRDLEDSKKRAFFSLNDARSWGYRVDEKCAPGYH